MQSVEVGHTLYVHQRSVTLRANSHILCMPKTGRLKRSGKRYAQPMSTIFGDATIIWRVSLTIDHLIRIAVFGYAAQDA